MSKYTDVHTLDDIKSRHIKEDKTIWTPNYDKPASPIEKGNDVWNKDILRSGVERFFLLKNDIMREIMESFGEYTGEIDYNKNTKITFKSDIKDSNNKTEIDWNTNFTEALIANFGSVALNGDFPLPPAIINYLKGLNSSGLISGNKILHGNAKARYEQAMFRVEELVKNGFPEYTALAIVGMTYTEDSWVDHGVINLAERAGGGVKGTGGAGAGESIIGITFIPTKIKVITKAGLWDRPGMGNPHNFVATYNFGISKLSMSDQIKCVIAYYQINGQWSKALLDIKNPNNDLLRTIVCCAAYRSKSGDSNWPGNVSDPNKYVYNTEHGRSGAAAYRNRHGYEGFSNGIIMAYLLATVIKAKKEGNMDWNKVTHKALSDIENIIGKIN